MGGVRRGRASLCSLDSSLCGDGEQPDLLAVRTCTDPFCLHSHTHHPAALSSAIVAADATNILSAAASLDHRLTSGRHGE